MPRRKHGLYTSMSSLINLMVCVVGVHLLPKLPTSHAITDWKRYETKTERKTKHKQGDTPLPPPSKKRTPINRRQHTASSDWGGRRKAHMNVFLYVKSDHSMRHYRERHALAIRYHFPTTGSDSRRFAVSHTRQAQQK